MHSLQQIVDALREDQKQYHWSQFSLEKYFVGAVPYLDSPRKVSNMVFDSNYEEPDF